MLNQQTVEKLHGMKLHGMADAFRAQLESTQNGSLSFEERLLCWSISNGYGKKIVRWPDACKPPD